MALVIGNKTANLGVPAASSQTFSHTQDSGTDRHLFIMIQMSDTATITGVTYNGVSMTEITSTVTTTYGTRWAFYELDDPAIGSNNIVINFSSDQFNPVSAFVVSATGCGGPGNNIYDDTNDSPNSGTITVSANSVILAGLLAGNSVGHDITLAGSSRTLEFTHNINNFTSGALSATGLSAGAKTVSVSAETGTAGNYLEITESGGGGSGIAEGNWIIMF